LFELLEFSKTEYSELFEFSKIEYSE